MSDVDRTNSEHTQRSGDRLTRRQILRIGMAGTVAIAAGPVLAACGPSPENQQAGPATVGPAGATPATTAPGGAGRAATAVTLRGIGVPATFGTIINDVFAPEYERQTGVKVTFDLVGRDAVHDKMGTLFAAKDPSNDIFNIDYNWIPEFARAGHLLPLDDVLNAPGMNREDFLQQGLVVGQWEGKQYGIPNTVHPHILWYRRDLFDDAGFQGQFSETYGRQLKPPTTMEEWRDIAEFFQNKEYKGQKLSGWAAQAAKGYGNVHTWLTFLYSFGGDAFNFDTMKPTLDTPEALAATQFWADIMKFTPPGINDYTYEEVTVDATQGKIATALHWSWSAFPVDDPKNSKTVGLWEFTTVPTGTSSVPHLAEWLFTVSKYSRNQDEAIKFIQWMESPENDVRQALEGGGDPVRRSSYNDSKLTEATVPGHPDLKRFRRYPATLKAMETTKPRPYFAEEERWETVVSTPLHAIQFGQSSAEEGLRKAQADVDRMMKELGYY